MALCLLAACSNSSSNDGQWEFESPLEAREVFNTSTISCPTGDCPESIAGLYTLEERAVTVRLGACSGTLIDENHIITNAHCVEDSIKKVGSSCTGKIKVNFPAIAGKPAERYDCDKVVAISEDSTSQTEPDWAILSFKGKSARKAVLINPNGVVQDSTVKLYKINYSDLTANKRNDGVIAPIECKANTNYHMADQFIGSQSALVNISHCTETLRNGNSGSGIMNSSDELIAVFSFGYIKEVKKKDEDGEWITEEVPLNAGGGTNAACIPALGHQVSPMCAFDVNDYSELAQKYVRLSEQRNDPAYAATKGEMMEYYTKLTPDVVFGTASQKLVSQFDYSYDGKLATVAQFVADSYVSMKFQYLPYCVQQTASNDFQLELLVRDQMDASVDLINQVAHRGSETRKVTYRFVKSDEDTYRMSAVGQPFPKEVSEDIFSISNFGAVDYYVPVCNDELLN